MSDNEHATAIREYATEIRDGGYTADILKQTVVAMHVDHIIRRAGALVRQLAEAEARAARLRKALIQEAKHALAFADEREADSIPDDEAIHVLRKCNTELQPGDLDDPTG